MKEDVTNVKNAMQSLLGKAAGYYTKKGVDELRKISIVNRTKIIFRRYFQSN